MGRPTDPAVLDVLRSCLRRLEVDGGGVSAGFAVVDEDGLHGRIGY